MKKWCQELGRVIIQILNGRETSNMNFDAQGQRPGGQRDASQEYMKPPTNLFDDNFLGAAQPGAGGGGARSFIGEQNAQLDKDQQVVKGIFGAQSQPGGGVGASADTSGLSERDRRLHLRALERQNRNQPGGGGERAYGVEPPPVSRSQPDIFGQQSSVPSNDREQRWQQKMQAAMNANKPAAPQQNNFAYLQAAQPQGQGQGGFQPATAFGQHLAAAQHAANQLSSPQMSSPMKRSLTAQKLQQAKDLDVSLNQFDQPSVQMQNVSRDPLVQMQQAAEDYYSGSSRPPVGQSPLVKQSFELKENNMISAIGNNDLDRQRAADIRAAKQQEYNNYLAAQAAKNVSARSHSANRPMQGDALQMAGMHQIGGHQFRQAEEKARLQKEYSEHLQSQMKQPSQQQVMQQSGSDWRRKQLADQVMNEVMGESARGGHQPPQSHLPGLPTIQPHQQQSMQQVARSAQGLPPRVTSAVGSNRRDEVQRMQRQSGDDPFHRDRRDDNSVKRREFEKKREYAALLQEQMAGKKHGLGANQQKELLQRQFERNQPVAFEQPAYQPSQPPLHEFHPPRASELHQGYSGPPQPLTSASQQWQPATPATGAWQSEESQLYQNPPSQFQPPMHQPVGMPPPSMPSMQPQPQFSAPPQQLPQHRDQPSPRANFPASMMAKEQAYKDAQAAEKRRIDEYRRELEEQMRLQEGKKRALKEEQARYDMANNQDTAEYIAQKPSIAVNLHNHPSATSANILSQPPAPQAQAAQGENKAIRLGTDITRQQYGEDPSKQAARLRYQEELKQQMEEQKTRKDAEAQKRRAADEEQDRRLEQEIYAVNQKEAQEIVKEGKREPPPVSRPGKAIRRDQLEPSAENKGIVGSIARMPTQPDDHASDPRHDLFTQAEPVAPQPLLPRNDNSTFGAPPPLGGQPGAHDDLFGPPPQQMVSLSSPTNNYAGAQLPAPHPQLVGQPPLPSFGQQLQQFQAQHMPSQPPSASQSDWMAQQQTQASKMFEDQQKMIALYQQALEQILQYRNQYFEQAMAMRENILKEREQLLEHEKMKQQQVAEMTQLKAVQNQLGTLMDKAHEQPVLNAQVQSNLNSYITKQKEQILQMSQSSASMSQIVRQANAMMTGGRSPTVSPTNQSPFKPREEPQFQFQQHSQMIPVTQQQQYAEQELPVTSTRVEIPTSEQVHFVPPSEDGENMDLQRQVDELAAQIAANDANNGQYPSQSPMLDFDQSLSSHSKMVKVPNENLQEKAAQLHRQQPYAGQDGDHLLETWNENSARKNMQREGVLSPIRDVRQIMSNSATPLAHGKFGQLGTQKSPLASSSVPQTIQELPHEEERGIVARVSRQQNASGFQFQSEGDDMNDRTVTDTEHGDYHKGASRPSIDAHDNLEKIERLVNKSQSGFADRKATITGSSFYERTMQHQKQQEANQQEEMQKQLLRILGGTSVSDSGNPEADNSPDLLQAFQEKHGPGQEVRMSNEQKHSTMKVRASAEGLDGLAQSYRLPEDASREVPPQQQAQDMTIGTNQSEINIANTQTSNIIERVNLDKFTNPSRMQDDQNQSAIQQIETSRMEEEKQQLAKEADMLARQGRDMLVVEESRKTFQPDSIRQSQSQSKVSQLVPPEEQSANEPSVWDDPDMVPVPVLPVFSENSMSYDAHETTHGVKMLARAEYKSPTHDQSLRLRNNASSIMHTDGTIAGLQRMVPDIIKTDSFEVNQVSDEVTGEQKLQITPLENRRHQQPIDESAPDFEQHRPQNETTEESKINVAGSQQSPRSEMQGAEMSQLSKKEQEMQEIEALIRKATNTVSLADERESARKRGVALKQNLKGSGVENSHATPVVTHNKQAFLPDAPSQFKEQHLQTADPSNGASRLQQMQAAAEPTPSPMRETANEQRLGASSNNDQQILADLDKIINNLEQQQKNMATFGVPKLEEADEEDDEDLEDAEPRQTGRDGTPPSGRPWQAPPAHGLPAGVPPQSQGAGEAPPFSLHSEASGTDSRSQWTSLQAARDEKKVSPRPITGKSSGKAPLPLGRPKSGLSSKSRVNQTTASQRCDASPQRVGKYAQMALQSNNPQAPLRQPSPLQKRLNVSRSPQSIGKYAQMALQSSGNAPNNVNDSSATKSPQGLGKFAQMALQNNKGTPSEAQVDDLSQRYARNPSRERLDRSNVSGDGRAPGLMNTSAFSQHQPDGTELPSQILRPVSGKGSSSRYGGRSPSGAGVPQPLGTAPQTGAGGAYGRPPSEMGPSQHAAQQQDANFRQTARTAGTQQTAGAGRLGQGSKLAYYSDEEDDQEQQMHMGGDTRNAFAKQHHQTIASSASGMTEMTQAHVKNQRNIDERGYN